MIKDLFGIPTRQSELNLRMPYQGSKNKIAYQLLDKMLEIKPNAKYFFDLFGGGGSMSFAALEYGLKVVYNEKQTSLVNFLKYIVDRVKNKEKGKFGLFPDDFYSFITREDFKVLKDEDSIKGQFARIVYSFGNGQTNYLFSPDLEKLKHLAHNIVIFRCEQSLKEFNNLTGKDFVLSSSPSWNGRRLDYMNQFSREDRDNCVELLQQLEQLLQLERLQQLEQLEQLQRLEKLEKLPPFTILNLSFEQVEIETPIEETLVYLDPPYRKTVGYIEDVLHNELDDYFRKTPYSCFMSEYEAPFQEVLTIDKIALFRNTNKARTVKQEKLYWNNV